MSIKERIFLVGGNGFVGSHFQDIYSSKFIFKTYDKKDDILNFVNLENSIKNFSPDYIINLASFSTINSAKKYEAELYDLSIHGNRNIIKALTNNKFKGTYLYVSSGEVYGYNTKKFFSEKDLLAPMNEYAVAKVMSETFLKFKNQSSNFRVLIARPFNHFGVNQSTNFFIPKLIQNIATQINNKKVLIDIKNCKSKRSYLNVADVCAAYLFIIKNKNSDNFSVFNVCNQFAYTIPELINPLLIKKKINFEYINSNIDYPDNTLMGDNAKLKQLGWNMQVDLTDSLEKILDIFLQ